MITAAVIGVGRMGSHHARVYAGLDGARLAGLADIDPLAAKTAADRFGGNVYLDYREMLRAERPQAVSVAVPARLHEEIAMAALESGAHVLVEKPLALSAESGARIVACARRVGRRLLVGQVERFSPAVRALKDELRAARPGQLRKVVCRRASPFPERVRDVGVVLDLALHDLDLLHFLTGQSPARVVAHVGRSLRGPHEDSLLGLLYYPSGLTALLDVNWLAPTRLREVSVSGEQGALRANAVTPELTWQANGREPVQLPLVQDDALTLELQAFLRAIAGEAADIPSGQENLSMLQLASALLEAGRTQQPRDVSYDLVL